MASDSGIEVIFNRPPMTANEYQQDAARTLVTKVPVLTEQQLMLLWCSTGLSGESGEVAEVIKKGVFHQHGLDEAQLKKELGDAIWYAAGICTVMGWKMEDVMRANIDKLRARYPEGFSIERSINRVE